MQILYHIHNVYLSFILNEFQLKLHILKSETGQQDITLKPGYNLFHLQDNIQFFQYFFKLGQNYNWDTLYLG